MSRRIKTRVGRLCKGLLSVTVVSISHVARRKASHDCKCQSTTGSTHLQGGVMIKESGKQGSECPVLKHMTLFSRVLGAFPLSQKPVDPAITIEILAYSYKIKKEAVLEFGVKCITAKPAATHPERSVERFNGHGLERPRAAFSLARDDLDSIAA